MVTPVAVAYAGRVSARENHAPVSLAGPMTMTGVAGTLRLQMEAAPCDGASEAGCQSGLIKKIEF